MKLKEHQAKEVFSRYEIPVPEGYLCFSSEEVREKSLLLLKEGASAVVLKAQVTAGGRGKGKILIDGKEAGGGVRIVHDADEAGRQASTMIGGLLTTVQNPAGIKVESLLVERAVEFQKQLYLSFAIDRTKRCIVCISSPEGGMEIEQLAKSTPEKIKTMPIQIETGFRPFNGRQLAINLGVEKSMWKEISRVGENLFNLFVKEDCTLAEVNPLVVTNEGKTVAIDAKISIDDNALYRHPNYKQGWSPAEEERIEHEARTFGLSYIKLNGNIGCLVNGAGLAMATMDIIKFYGGEPANFLDVGGTASQEAVEKAFTIILTDPNVRCIFVNIFGGIMRCDVIAKGIVGATSKLDLKIPLVVRLEGNRVEEGKKILSRSGLSIISAESMADGASKAVKAAGEFKQ